MPRMLQYGSVATATHRNDRGLDPPLVDVQANTNTITDSTMAQRELRARTSRGSASVK